MKRINVRRMLSLLACAFMIISTLGGPAVAAKADGTEAETVVGGGLHWVNCYDWSGNGSSSGIYVFASADETASASTIIAQPAGTFGWWYSLVLEYNEETGNYVVVVSDMVMDGTNATETATLGTGKISIMFHGDALTTHADSCNYFLEHAEVGTEYQLVGDYEAMLVTAGALTDTYLVAVETEEPTVPEEPTVTEESGYVHWANCYDWSGNGSASGIYVFASADETATASTIIAQPVGTFGWWYSLVLEYDEAKDAYVVVVSDMEMDGNNATETATLGKGKISLMFHGDAMNNHADSCNFFMNHAAVGTEYKLTGDYDAIVATSGALTEVCFTATTTTGSGDTPAEPTPEPTQAPTPTPEPLPESTIGYLTKSNAYNWLDDHLKQILVLTSDDPELEASAVLGQSSANNVFGWWYGILLEYNEEKGVFVVTAADMNPDGVCEMEAEKLGYGKMVILFYPDVKAKQLESYSYFLANAAIGTEHYLVGNYDDMIWVYDKLADTYLTTVKPETYWTKSDATPTPEPTATTAPAEPTPEPTQAPEPAVQDNPGMNPIVIAIIVVVVVAVAGVVLVVVKKRK